MSQVQPLKRKICYMFSTIKFTLIFHKLDFLFRTLLYFALYLKVYPARCTKFNTLSATDFCSCVHVKYKQCYRPDPYLKYLSRYLIANVHDLKCIVLISATCKVQIVYVLWILFKINHKDYCYRKFSGRVILNLSYRKPPT